MIPGLRLRFFRALWTACVEYGAPRPLLLWVEGHFLDAGLRETLRRSAAEYRDECRDSFAYGQSDEPWSCLAGDVPDHDAGEVDERDLFDVCEQWPSSRQGKWEA